jgi:hypothetical protein
MINSAVDGARRACKTAPALAVQRTLQRGVAITARSTAVTAGPSLRELRFSGPVGNLYVYTFSVVVSETFAQTGKVFFSAFNLSEVKAVVLKQPRAQRYDNVR